MTKYLQPGGFSFATPGTKEYRDNWDAIFGPKQEPEPTPLEIWSSNIEDAQKKVFEELATLDAIEREPLALGPVQRRIREWAEHNFPLKAKDEHRRMAREFFERNGFFDVEDVVDPLAYLLASRESRSHRMLLGACEELGELCHAHLKNEQGIRGTPEEWREAKKDAIGDTLIYLMDYCNKEDLDIEECLQMALDEIATRDWVKYPKNGKTE